MPRLATECEALSWIATRHGKDIAEAFWKQFSRETVHVRKYREPKADQLDLFAEKPQQSLPHEALRWLAQRLDYAAAIAYWKHFSDYPVYIPLYRTEIDPLTEEIARLNRAGKRAKEIARQLGVSPVVVWARLRGPRKRKQYLHLPA